MSKKRTWLIPRSSKNSCQRLPKQVQTDYIGYQPTNQPGKKQASKQPSNQPTNQPIRQSTKQSANHFLDFIKAFVSSKSFSLHTIQSSGDFRISNNCIANGFTGVWSCPKFLTSSKGVATAPKDVAAGPKVVATGSKDVATGPKDVSNSINWFRCQIDTEYRYLYTKERIYLTEKHSRDTAPTFHVSRSSGVYDL